MADMSYWPVFKDSHKMLRKLTVEQCGRVFFALMDFADNNAEMVTEDPLEEVVFGFMKSNIEHAAATYDKKSAAGKKSGESRGNKNGVSASGLRAEEDSGRFPCPPAVDGRVDS